MASGKTSKICPHCGCRRIRRFDWFGPYSEGELNKSIPIREPSKSNAITWWNKGVIRRWISTSPGMPYYLCHELTECVGCGFIADIDEKRYYRQFGRARSVIIKFAESSPEFIRHILMGNTLAIIQKQFVHRGRQLPQDI
jgi:hypothetical protein